MNQEVLLYILGGVFICIGAGAGAVLMLLGKISDIRERVIALEIRDEYRDKKLAEISHSPHNPYGWDEMIDNYLDRHYELTNDQWKEWLRRCEVVINDKTKPKEDRILAIQLAAICWHKLHMPPPLRRQIEQAVNAAEDTLEREINKQTKT